MRLFRYSPLARRRTRQSVVCAGAAVLGCHRQSRRRPCLADRRRSPAESPLPAPPDPADLLAPIGSQEVWAAGVTYFRSRTARMEESKSAGGGDFYDRVYGADRPELFFKASPHRVRGSGETVRIRRDARWNVPEPELTLAVTSSGAIVGYTIGNDMSSRDIEGENPLYLPQAKVYDGSCGSGTCASTSRRIRCRRTPRSASRFGVRRPWCLQATTSLAAMKRTPRELVDYLFRDNSFPHGLSAADRHRHRAARRLHAGRGRRGDDRHRADRHARQHGRRWRMTGFPLRVWPGRWAVCRLDAGRRGAGAGRLAPAPLSVIARSQTELSILVARGARARRGDLRARVSRDRGGRAGARLPSPA